MSIFFSSSYFTSYFWLLLFVVLIVIEVSTYNLTTIWFALACIPLIFISWFKVRWTLQLLLFVALTALLLVFTKPFVLRRLECRKKNKPNMLNGKTATVTKKIIANGRGTVKTNNGVTWNAVAEAGVEIAEGSDCVIVKVEGNTLLVKAV